MHTNVSTADIHTRAILVWLTITTWAARKHDKRATDKVHAEYGANSKAGRYNKQLLADAPEYKALISLSNSIRAWHYGNTLAWSDEGWRILPIANYDTFTKGLREQMKTWDGAKGVFIPRYPTLVQDMRSVLNGLYNPADYPAASDIGDRFTITVQYAPVPAAGDIRVSLAADQLATIESSITDRVTVATQTAMSDAWQRLYECVSNIQSRLQDPKAIFRDSLIDNAREVCDALTRLNITNDPDLEAMRARVAAELTTYAPDTLREVPRVRQETADKAADIISAMSGLYGVAQ
jgi:hypothetical protein